CGTTTLLDKQIRCIRPDRLSLWMRPELAEFCRKNLVPKLKVQATINQPLDDEPALIMSARSLHFSRFAVPSDPCVTVDHGNIIRNAFVKKPGLSPADAITRTDAWLDLTKLPQAPAQSRLPQYLWDLINWNEEALVAYS